MKLFENDIVLPGVMSEIVPDYKSVYDTSLFGTTDSVVIIGTAFNGPVGKAVEIYSPEQARYVFGPVYDSKTRKEATLVANIQDAWDRGCRTIYAFRISGKSISKDYQLASDTNLKLRVAGIFPSNSNKDVCMAFNNDAYEMNIQIFKPAHRATINEKRQGRVESLDSVIVNRIDLYNGGITKEDDLIELIKRVNDFPYNNVIRLSIVDENGNDVTLSSLDAKAIKVGDVFPGVYTIGRDSNVSSIIAETKLELSIIEKDDDKPYGTFEGNLFKKLSLNTNVAMDLPIFSDKKNLHEILGISSLKELDFLTVPGKIDEIFSKDKVDYEEVDISDFDLYKKLGSGYGVNAEIKVVNGKFKVKEVIDKAKKKTEIKDGMYSMLENLTVKYRVLCGVSADSIIKGKLPKADEFKFAKTTSTNMLDSIITVESIVDKKDLTAAKSYSVSFESLETAEENELAEVKKSLFTGKTVRQATLITADAMKKNDKEYKEGSLFLVTGIKDEFNLDEMSTLLFTYSNGKFKNMHKFVGANEQDLIKGEIIVADEKLYICSKQVQNAGASTEKCNTFQPATTVDVENKKFTIVCLENGTFVVAKLQEQIDGEGNLIANNQGLACFIIGTVASVLNDQSDKLMVSLSSSYNKNNIKIKSNQFDFLTVDEVAELLNEDKDFSKLFNIKVLDITRAQENIEDLKGQPNVELTADLVDKEITFDTNLLIPFRTEDTFGRHLAQHCAYTSVKTAPTHGIMGTKILLDLGLDSISNRVNDLVELRLDTQLVAKKGNGTDILDNNNMPYPIGRKLSVVVGQYQVTTSDNYSFISNMAAGYAGMISKLPLDQSSTCQPIDIPNQMYELTNYQLSTLTSAGFVTIKKSFTKGWVITDGITMATPESAYRRLSSSRIADGIDSIIRSVCEPFIGKQNHLTNQNSLRSAIKSELDKLKDKLIEAYDFKLIVDKASTKLGVINIDYSIVPIYEIKTINNTINISE